MPTSVSLDVNGRAVTVIVDDPGMPLLYALRDNLELNGPRFGCGLGQCGSCTVLVDGEPVLSCEPRQPRKAVACSTSLHRRTGSTVRLLSQRHDHTGDRTPRKNPESDRSAD